MGRSDIQEQIPLYSFSSPPSTCSDPPAYLSELFTLFSNLLALSFRAYPVRTVINRVHNTASVEAVLAVMFGSFDPVDCVVISEGAILSVMNKT